MSLPNYITLNHLQQTAAALLQKIYDKEVDVNINTFTDGERDFQTDNYGNLQVGTIKENEIKIPLDWIQSIVPTYSVHNPVRYGSDMSLVTTGEKYRWNSNPIGYVDGSDLVIGYLGSNYNSIGFYFFIPVTSVSNSETKTTSVLINTIKATNENINYGITSVTFTKSGLYYGYMKDGVFNYELIGETPSLPTTTGTYCLQCTITNDIPTYSWIAVPAASGVSF